MLVLRRIKMNLDAIPGRSSPVMHYVLWKMSLEGQLRPMPTAINTPNIATIITQGFFLMNSITLSTFHVVG